MKKKTFTSKAKQVLFRLCLAAGILTAVPASAGTESDSFTRGVINGGTVSVLGERITAVREKSVFQGNLDEDGEISNLYREFSFPSTLYSLAQDDPYLYISRKNVTFRLEPSRGQNPDFEEFLNLGLFDGFQIYDGCLYYLYGTSLYLTDPAVKEKITLAKDVEDFEVTSEGIFFTTETGSFCRTDYQGQNTETLRETEPECRLTLWGDRLYIYHQSLMFYRLSDGSFEEIQTVHQISPYDYILPANDYLIYNSKDVNTYKYEFSSGMETKISYLSIPDKRNRVFYKNHLYYTDSLESLCDLNLGDLHLKEINLKEIEKKDSLQIQKPPASSTDNWDIGRNLYSKISDGNAFLASDYFYLNFNYRDFADGNWEWNAVDETTIIFFYSAAKAAGYGGRVFSLAAYDRGNDSYMDAPSWHIAGTSANKVYVVFYPTDLQYNPQDCVQTETYNRMLNFAMTIDNGSLKNPFSCTQ